ncbi:hypothetical protein EG329_000663 [Mollisiaceae sp. DMI_Dod_QoI]|nr:hypothetical protein EG329_000663 [Helotiales sp. DMI_Dod_QoI]
MSLMGRLQAKGKAELWQLAGRDGGDCKDEDHSCSTTTAGLFPTLALPPLTSLLNPPKSKPPKDINVPSTSSTSLSRSIVPTSTSVTVTTSRASSSSNLGETTVFTTISTSTTFSTLPHTSTQGSRSLATVTTILMSQTSSLSPTPSSAAQGISSGSDDYTGFLVGIGVAIGETSYDGGGLTSGPPVPERAVYRENEANTSFHPDGLSIHPMIHGPSVIVGTKLKVEDALTSNLRETTATPIAVSAIGLRQISDENLPYRSPTVNTGKVRATSAPVGADILKITREQELERELGIERMGKEWESIRKRATGEGDGNIDAESEASLPRWGDPVTWVRDQRARMMSGRMRLHG